MSSSLVSQAKNSSLNRKGMAEPYASVKLLPFDPHGWFYNGEWLHECMTRRAIKNVVEVGSWLGTSTRFMAERLPIDGKVYAVDTWEGSKEHRNDPRLPTLFQQFLSNTIHFELTDKIVPIRMHSLEAAVGLAIAADLIYIDASHETEDVFADVMHWHPHLAQNGLICGDDWNYKSVQHAVLDAAFQLKAVVRFEGKFWWFE